MEILVNTGNFFYNSIFPLLAFVCILAACQLGKVMQRVPGLHETGGKLTTWAVGEDSEV